MEKHLRGQCQKHQAGAGEPKHNVTNAARYKNQTEVSSHDKNQHFPKISVFLCEVWSAALLDISSGDEWKLLEVVKSPGSRP